MNVEPLNFKLDTTVTSTNAENIAMEVEPVTVNSSETTETSKAEVPLTSTMTSTTKIYANLESAMPVSTISSQPPITIQTIEVTMKSFVPCIEFLK